MLRPVAVSVANDPDFGRNVRLIEYDRPASGSDDAETAQSIGLMQQLAARDTIAASVQNAASEAVEGLSPDASFLDICDAVFWWIKNHVRYMHESALQTPFTDVAGIVYDQTLIPPAALLSMPEPYGDCPHFSMLTASMLRIFSVPAAFKTIAADRTNPNSYSHVYVVAQIRPGQFYAMDTSNGPAPGAEFAHPTKAKLWPNHQDTSKEEMIRTRKATHTRIDDANRLRLAGLADATDADTFINSVLSAQPQPYDLYGSAGVSTDYTGTQFDSASSSAVPSSAPSSASGGLSKFFSVLANDATSMAAPLIRQSQIKAPYYIAGANGAQILYDPSTGKTANAGSGSGLTGGGSNSLLLMAAAAVALIALSSGRR